MPLYFRQVSLHRKDLPALPRAKENDASAFPNNTDNRAGNSTVFETTHSLPTSYSTTKSRNSRSSQSSSTSSRPCINSISSSRCSQRSSVRNPFHSDVDPDHSRAISDAAKRRIRSDIDVQTVFTKSMKSNRTGTSSILSNIRVKVVRKAEAREGSVIDEDDEGLDEATREAGFVTRMVGKKWEYEG